MKPRKVYLDELTDTTKNYKVNVRVIEKRRPKASPVKVQYQSLLFEDDKGNKMRAALFADQVDIYEDAIKRNQKYEISNASISPLKPEYKTNESGLDYQMTFNRRTVIMPMDIDGGCADVNYRPISQIPRAPDYSEMFDIVGVVLFVEDQPRKIVTAKARETAVREVILIDNSTTQPLSISVWDDLVQDDCTLLISEPGKFRAVGITALRVSMRKGFSMTTSASTVFVHSPDGDKADALKAWMASHTMALTKLQNRLFNVKMPVLTDSTTTISTLRSKKAKTTLQDERHWLEVTIPDVDFEKINAYMGCSNCSKRSNIQPGNTYTCDSCAKPNCTSEPKVTFNCEVSDGTGTLSFTMFTDVTEQLFRMSASDIFHMKHNSDEPTFTTLKGLLDTKPFKAQVAPANSLSTNNVLQWIIKRVVVSAESSGPELTVEQTNEGTTLESQHVGDVNIKHLKPTDYTEHDENMSTIGSDESAKDDQPVIPSYPTIVDSGKDVAITLSHPQLPKRKCRKEKTGSPSAVLSTPN